MATQAPAHARTSPGSVHLSGGARVWLLSGAMALAALALYAFVVRRLEPVDGEIDAPWWAFVPAFLALESHVVHVHFRREAHTFSMTELVIVMGLFMLAPSELLAAHLIGAGLALALIRRQRPVKIAFNLSLFALCTATAVSVFHALPSGTHAGEPLTWLAALVAIATSAALGVGLVAGVIAVAEGEWDARSLPKLIAIGGISAVANGGVALIAVELIRSNAPAVVLLLLPVAAIVATFRAYTSQHARHEHLEFLYDSMRTTQSARDFDTAVREVLIAAKRMVRAEFAELVLLPGNPEEPVFRSRIPASGELVMESTELTTFEQHAIAAVASSGGAVILPRGEPAGEFGPVLESRGLEDAMLVALRNDSRATGMLLVGARSGDLSTFGPADGRLLDTFASHASVLLENDRLEEAVTQLRDLQEELRHQAYHDALTGLPNRARLIENLEKELGRDSREELALLFLDIDDFKTVNDTLGHGVGDELLIRVARRIRSSIRPGDVPTRLGGDEFAVLLRNVDTEGAQQIADRIGDALRAPFPLADRELVVRASIGIAVTRPQEVSAGDLLRHADVAMYTAKRTGKGRHSVYTEDMHERLVRRLELSEALDQALESSTLSLHYQPIVRLADGHTIAFEALLRWRHPTRGYIPPTSFLPLAAETGALASITPWVLLTACSEARSWDAAGPSGVKEAIGVTVNLSPSDLQNPALAEEVARALEQSGLSPERLTLEITESDAIDDLDAALRAMRELGTLGVQLALDDFGTGHSSLEKLGDFPLDILKIAKPFVDRLAGEPADTVLIDAILRLGHAMGMRAVAEGVELERQADLLLSAGCEYAQGFWFALPLHADVVHDFLGGRLAQVRQLGVGQAVDLAFPPLRVARESR